jgi:CheY-like chemotaxis protein
MVPVLRVLACTVPGTEPRLRAVLPDAELHFVFETEEALGALRHGSFDLVLVGIRFDESRALELLRRIEAEPDIRLPPLVGMRGAKSAYRVLPEVFDIPMLAMGACDVIDFSDIPNDEAGNAAVRERLLRCCGR